MSNIVIDVKKFRRGPKHIVARSKYIFIAVIPLVETNFLKHIQVIFTTAKPNYRDLINLLLPLFFSPPLKAFEKSEGYGYCFKTSATIASCFSVKT